MPAYTYYAADTMTGRLLAELPLEGVSYELVVNDAGKMSARLPLVRAVPDVLNNLVPGRTSIYVDRDGTLVYGGLLWGRKYSSGSPTIALDCQDFLSYLDHLYITSDLNFSQIEQLAIGRALVDYGMKKGGSDLGLEYLGDTASGVLRDRSYLGLDRKNLGEALRQLAAVDNGYDFRFGVRWNSGYLRRTVQFGYPGLGRKLAVSRLVFEYESDLQSFDYNEDAASSANVIYAVGGVSDTAPAGTLPPTYLADAADVRGAGFPRLESSLGYSDIYVLATLTAHAVGQLTMMRRPLLTMTLTADTASGAPPPGTFLPGDEALLRVGMGDNLFANGVLIQGVITSIGVTVSDEWDEAIGVGLVPSAITVNPVGQLAGLTVDQQWNRVAVAGIGI